ncbi:hypothetical protein VF21_07356 [Pseudogymnoascus sp. 05NY08]|nr:hypothetical protein VF21_07356 [Pseudogymnoascus sp. 05NY08]
MRFTVRGFVRVICCLYLPVDETKEANSTDRQKDDDWLKPVSGAGVISELDAVPVSRPARSTLSRGIRRASTAITGRLSTPNLSVPTELPPRRSNNNQEDASTQTDFDDCLGQNGSQTSRHRTSLPTNLRVGRAVLSGSVTDKRRIGRCCPIMEDKLFPGKWICRSPKDMTLERSKMHPYYSAPEKTLFGKGKKQSTSTSRTAQETESTLHKAMFAV